MMPAVTALGGKLLEGIGGGIVGKVLGGLFGGDDDGSDAREMEYQRQKEFAQMGIRWRVNDAVEAGLHPLAALGGMGASYSPSAVVGSSAPDFSSFLDGQNTKRAEVATQTAAERELEQLALERARLQNRLLEGQIAAEWASVMGAPPTPPMPDAVGPVRVTPVPTRSIIPTALDPAPGQVVTEPSKGISTVRGDKGLEASATPGFKRYGITPRTSFELPNQQLSESLEGMGVAGHLLGPALVGIREWDKLWNGGTSPDPKLLPKGYRWEWNRWRQSWSPVKSSK